jgi:hypothetical protein
VANTFITPSWVTKDVAVNFKNNLKLIGQFDRTWDNTWENKPQGAQIGYTVQVRIQQRWVVSEGQALVEQPILNQTVPMTINHQFQIGMGWSSADDALVVEEVQNRYTKPAGRAQANKWDVVAGAEVFKQVYYSIGSPGTPIADDQIYTDGVAKMRNVGVPEEFVAVLDPKSQSRLLSANFALFNPQAQISKYFRSGQFSGPALGVDSWYWDPNMPTFTTGTFTTATPITSSGGQTGSTLALSGMGTYAMVQGDVFTIAGVNAVNPVSYVDTGDLQQFVLTAPLAGTTTGTFAISPPIITSGPLQTVTAAPGNGAAIQWLGATGTVAATMAAQTSRQSLLFNPAAFAFVMVDLPKSLPGAIAKRVNGGGDFNLSLRFVEQYNIQTDQLPSRIDSIGGVAAMLPYFALRAWS